MVQKLSVCIPLCLALYGCADMRSQQDAFPKGLRTSEESVPAQPTLSSDDVAAIVRTESQQSSNAIQQSTQGIVGASVGKLAEKVDAALAKIEATVNAKAELNFAATAYLRAEMEANLDISARVQAQAEAILTLNAKIDALAAAQGQFVAGFNNTLSQTVQKLEAGRDVNNTSFTTEMASVMERAYKSVTTVVYIMAGALVTILTGASVIVNRSKEHSRKREEARNGRLQDLLEKSIMEK